MKFKQTLAFFLFSISFYGQQKSIALVNYELGVKYFKEGKLVEADSFFTLSIASEPNVDSYYNKAVVNKKLGNFKTYCECIENAANYEDKEAKDLYKSDCVNIDTFFVTENYKKASAENYFYKLKYVKSRYTNHQEYFRYDNKNNIDLSYEITNNDTAYTKFPKNFMDSLYSAIMPILNRVIITQIAYPQAEKELGISGTVYLEFYFDKRGVTGDIKILRAPAKNLAIEAARVIKLLPTINPIVYQGKPVKVKFITPVKFTLK